MHDTNLGSCGRKNAFDPLGKPGEVICRSEPVQVIKISSTPLAFLSVKAPTQKAALSDCISPVK